MNETATFARPPAEARRKDDGLEVRSIAKSYDQRAVLHDVSLDVHRGEVVGLLGPNGAGKTTCFYSVMGLVKPDSGRIYLDGSDITELPMYRRPQYRSSRVASPRAPSGKLLQKPDDCTVSRSARLNRAPPALPADVSAASCRGA